MQSKIAIAMALALGACASGGGEPPPLAPLEGDREQPVLALFEHVLTGYFAGVGATAPTTCTRLSPTPLSTEQETALIARFVRLAPAERCESAAQGTVDAIRAARAVVQVYQFSPARRALASAVLRCLAPGHTLRDALRRRLLAFDSYLRDIADDRGRVGESRPPRADSPRASDRAHTAVSSERPESPTPSTMRWCGAMPSSRRGFHTCCARQPERRGRAESPPRR